MGSIITKIREALSHPEKVLPYLRKISRTYLRSIRYLDIQQLVDTTGYLIFGGGFFRFRYDKSIVRDIQGNKMRLRTDQELCQQLLAYGVRERVTTRAYWSELERLRGDVSGTINVLEIGANIGYYALLAADVLGDRGRVFAIEPVSETYSQLVENIHLNGYEDQFSTEMCGVRAQSGTANVAESSKFNQYRLVSKGAGEGVDVVDPDGVFDLFNLSPNDIHVIRMDLEGQEFDIVPLFERILTTSMNVLVQVELHPRYDKDGYDNLCEIMRRNNVEILSVAKDDSSTTRVDWDNLTDQHFRQTAYFELVARKPKNT